MVIVQRGCAPQNFRVGRPPGLVADAIVVHRSGGSLASLRARFADPASAVSAHYAVGLDGVVEQYLDEADTAFHAGLVMNPTWVGLRADTNPNFHTVAVELEGSAASGWPEAQRQAAGHLIAEIANRWSIAIGVETVIPHRAIRASADCPGPDFPADDVLRWAREDQGRGGPGTATTDEMERHEDATTPLGAEPAIDRTTLALSQAQYCTESVRKDLIVLHFTAGRSARSAVNTWRATPERVATAYVVDADGTIYEVFPPSSWAWHLGVKGGVSHERRSIGIEMANVGPLQSSTADLAVLNWWPRDWKEPYCRRDDAGKFVEKEYRDKRFFATFAGAQLDAVARLVHHLCERFDIPRIIPPAGRRLEFDSLAFAGYKGIATHVNFREDKWDVGPAFDWDRLGL